MIVNQLADPNVDYLERGDDLVYNKGNQTMRLPFCLQIRNISSNVELLTFKSISWVDVKGV